ncbi:hypothetical protein KZP23_14885 [Echinicola marina]|uniref:hypothetical protein n=1 Tax=Echinicola marina TaxID=2859768 RepID=UPI001CF6D783|nr:hypothetical protein [Echinicola marina]UCS92003.1 hypothetical protein KZP23_14885 [Echinicola marina]
MLQYLFIILLIGLCIADNRHMVKKKGLPKAYLFHLQALLVFHMLMVLVFSYYIGQKGGDSQGYWALIGPLAHPHASSWGDYFGVGYPFMYWLNYIPSKVLNWSWYTGNMLYGLLGYYAFRYLSHTVYYHYQAAPQFRGLPMALLLLYWPNIHFWTAGVGKEALCFWGLSALLFALSRGSQKRYWALGMIGLASVFMVRTYLAAIMAIALVLLFLMDFKKLSKSQKQLFWRGLFLLVLCIPAIYRYSGIKDLPNINPIAISQQQIAMLSGEGIGSSVPVKDYGLAMRLITYWFRPFVGEIKGGLMYMAAAIENALLIVLLLFFLVKAKWQAWRKIPLFLRYSLVLFVLTSLLYANSLGNLGIMMRMKAPYMLLIILFMAWMYQKKSKQTSQPI